MGNQMKQILENFAKPEDEKVKIRSEKKSKRKGGLNVPRKIKQLFKLSSKCQTSKKIIVGYLL